MSQYESIKSMLERSKCKSCYGLGTKDDSACGDIFYNTWQCEECNGTGLNKDISIINNQIQTIVDWVQATDTNSNAASAVARYIGLILEEVSELLDAINRDESKQYIWDDQISECAETVESLADEFKSGFYDCCITRLNEEELTEALDGAVDIAWVATGLTAKLSTNPIAAFDAVIRSNNSKFVNGTFLKDENGKVIKPDTFVAPDFTGLLREIKE